MDDWAEIRRLHRAEGLAVRAIARHLQISKNTVKRALAAQGPPRYVRSPLGSAVDEFEQAIRGLLAEFPSMPTSVIMERVGWTRGKTVFFERVAALRPLFVPPDPASRIDYEPGQLAQCDLWFRPVDIPVGYGQVARPPVLVLVSGFSRMITARMLPSRQSPDLLAGHWELLCGWGLVPKTLVWDNESAVGRWRAGRPELTRSMNEFRGTLGIRVRLCAPRDPESKGMVNGPTDIWKPRSCRAAASPTQPISTGNSPTGCNWRTSGRIAGWGAGRWIGGTQTGPRWEDHVGRTIDLGGVGR